ncbi:hypothetical protein GCM10011583_23780 [Streptomyces camponoticapitis]|uniref:Uncharacterized protein n=1 Tax=Streptomyces camponoticapitis TaxID=1616125 RepID=A0ABQ2E3N5_9ACTN|nr:hypothetical protein [Streptomyces camponoticapitis]GGJ91620.1 hypothetical protein GCM10011583_23780 [Streptomyces camponoticapitis]
MRIRTAVAASALAALAVLGSAGAAAAGERGEGHDRGNSIVNSEFVATWINDSFNTAIIFGDNL